MYGKEEASLKRKKFWTSFGQYLKPIPSAEGLKVNWLNYKTGIKDVFFRMNAVKKEVYIGIELHHSDHGIRELFFEQFKELQTYLHSIMEEEWIWIENYEAQGTGKQISRIYTHQNGYSILNEENWPPVIQFLKPRIIKLDEFWSDARHSFDVLK